MQQQRHGLPVQIPASSGTANPQRVPTAQLLGRGGEPPRLVVPLEELGPIAPFRSKRASITKDWSMKSGAQTPQSLTVTVNSNTASGTATFTVDVPTAQKLTGSAPTAEVETIQYSSSTAPATGTPGSSVTVGTVTYTFVTSSSATPSSGCSVVSVSGSTGATDLYDALTAAGASSSTYRCATGVGANSAVTATIST